MIAWILGIFTFLGGIAAIWFFWDKIQLWFHRESPMTPELSANRNMVQEIGLESRLKDAGYRLFWGNVRDSQYYLQFGDYELIEWTDPKGQKWLLTSAPGGDLPLKTRFSSEEIQARRDKRKNAKG